MRGPIAIAALLLALVAAGVVRAQPAHLYATYGPADTGPSGPIGVVPGQSTPVHLWLAGGSIPSTPVPCVPAARGDEICGYNFALETSADFTFQSPAPDTSFDTSGSGVGFPTSITPGRYAANGFDLGTPPVGNRHLGTITILAGSGVSTTDSITVSGGVVGANLEMRGLVVEDVVVPEPGLPGALALGVALLCLLVARRRVADAA
jgi:hypothetical protein